MKGLTDKQWQVLLALAENHQAVPELKGYNCWRVTDKLAEPRAARESVNLSVLVLLGILKKRGLVEEPVWNHYRLTPEGRGLLA